MINIDLNGDPSKLTFELEQLGNHPNKWEAFGLLVYFLEHESSLVREGAVYDLSKLGNMPGLKEVLSRRLSPEIEKSPGVGWAIRDILEYL